MKIRLAIAASGLPYQGMVSQMPVATAPGWKALTVTPVPSSLRASSRV
ncbi:Uncharacterised protein [Mycobacteroides abscessus subsp. abscessus]|nr:Uncharacterised protein [Mycobacteroides abscessus subsp. abscessus]